MAEETEYPRNELDEGKPLSPEWHAEIKRRMDEYRKDPSIGRPLEDVLQEADEVIAKIREDKSAARR